MKYKKRFYFILFYTTFDYIYFVVYRLIASSYIDTLVIK